MIAERSVSILLVDDAQQFRQGLRTLLGFYSGGGTLTFNVVGEAASAEQAVQLAVEQRPALILLDLELPPEDGIAVLQKLRELLYKGKVLVLSAHREDEWIFRAMQAGASGYVFKDSVATQLHEAIATVMAEEVYLSHEVATRFFRMFQFYARRERAIGSGSPYRTGA